MPIYEYKCNDCEKAMEILVLNLKPETQQDLKCIYCESVELTKLASLFGGYNIKGDNSGSKTPKQAGSFKNK